jgi:hypothetical protein
MAQPTCTNCGIDIYAELDLETGFCSQRCAVEYANGGEPDERDLETDDQDDLDSGVDDLADDEDGWDDEDDEEEC